MATCTLEIGERVVLRSNGGPPEAEYALFDAGELELSATEPGTVREVGYRTVAADAAQRLEAAGITPTLAREAASAIGPTLAATYARGAAARRVASLLGPVELFEGAVYDYELRRYEGRWLDLPALGLDVELSRATTLMQAIYLSSLLQEVDPRTAIVMTTLQHSLERRPGERSYRRVSLEHATNLPAALRALAGRDRRTAHRERDVGPSREDLLEALRERTEASNDGRARDRISAIANAMSQRQRPARGPLADAELWNIEEQLSAGNAFGVIERLDAIDKKSGRHPATTYLRARASLVSGREPARVVAERATALAMAMTSFAECGLLAAEAWSAAGELRRAIPFARDLVSNPNVHEDLRARANRVVEAAEKPERVDTVPRTSFEGPAVGSKPSTLPPPPSPPPPYEPEDSFDLVPVSRPPPRSISDELTLSLGPQRPPSQPAFPLSRPPPKPTAARKETPLMSFSASPKLPSLPAVLSAPAHLPQAEQRTTTSPAFRGPPHSARVSSPISSHSRGAIDATRPRESSQMKVTSPKTGQQPAPLAEPARAPPHARQTRWIPAAMMHGASLPPYRSDSPDAHVHVPRAPKIPGSMREPEHAATLALPPGVTGSPAPADTLPTSLIDARVQFTFLARELAREYRNDLGVELRIDLGCIEAIQGRLLERYPAHKITTPSEALDVRKHGALLSEVLARTLDAFWVDIGPSDLGYWAMIVPPDTRVWPFGRILRLIALQHKERDLVAYYLELQSRSMSMM